MVAVLPDSSPDLWRLCHNLGLLSGSKPSELPYLVVVKSSLFSFFIGLNRSTQLHRGTIFNITHPLEVGKARVYGRTPSRRPFRARVPSRAGNIWYNI